MALWEPDTKCSEYTNPIARWMGNCPDVRISPIIVTPAAPRSVAEMTSGLWTPAEAMRLTLEKYTAEKQRQRDLAVAGNWQMPSGDGGGGDASKKELDASDWVLIGGAVIAGLVVVKSVLR
jgi:hypothetical protein